ncbi:MAG: hypothetical protein AABM29_09420 [Actinomycetota bacterium]
MQAFSASVSAQLRELGERARGETPRRRIAWGAIAAALVLLPVAFNVARESSFTASVEIFPRAAPPYGAISDPGYYRSFVTDAALQQEMQRNAGAGIHEYHAATFRPTPQGTVLLGVSSDDRARAQQLVNALAPQIMGASGRQLERQIAEEAAVLRARIRYQRLQPDDRRALGGRLRQIERLDPIVSDRAVLGAAAREPRLERLADRVADAMPGGLPDRPNPMSAGLAGLLLFVTLWTIGLVRVPPAAAPAMTPQGARPRRAARASRSVALPRGAPAAILATAAIAFVAIIMVLGRDLETFRLDEWTIIADRQGSSFDDFVRPHNEHLSLLPVAVFKGLFATVGMEPYWPYRLAVAVLSVLIGVLVYLYARPRLGRGWALAPALLSMLIGQGAYDIIWPFQIGFDLSVACGVGVLLCFDRPGTRSDLIAGALVLFALLSSSIGIAVAVAAAVEVIASPGQRRARALRILALPVLAYVAWWLHYRPESADEAAGLVEALRLLVDVSGAAVAGLFGTPISLHRLLAVTLAVAVVVGIASRRGGRRRLLVACSLPGAYWVLLVLGRGSTGAQLLDSRYILPGSVFVACMLSELLRGSTARARPWMAGLVALGVLLSTVNHVRYVRDTANLEVEARAEVVRARVAALSLAGQAGPIDRGAQLDPATFPVSSPARLFEAFDRLGDPVSEPDETIAASSAAARAAADTTYVTARGLRALPGGSPPFGTSCRTLAGPSAEVLVPARGLALRGSGRGPVSVAVRRWGATSIPAGDVPGRSWVRLIPGRDAAQTPVRARVDGFDVRVCPLPGS